MTTDHDSSPDQSPRWRNRILGDPDDTSESELPDPPPFFPCSGSQEFPGWYALGTTGEQDVQRPFRSDALTIQMLPIFLPPRDSHSFNDWANISLETACTPLPVTQNPFRAIVPSFWVCSTAATRVAPQDISTQRLIVYLMRAWMDSMELVWDVSPDFLTRWSPQYRVLTVYPLVSTLLTTNATSASSHSIADRAYRPVVTALQDAYTSTQISTLDLTPLLCFITGQYFSSSFPNPDKYPSNTFSLLTPRTLSSQQCELILRIARRWQSHIPHHDRDRPASEIARHFIDAWYASPEPSTSSGYAPPTSRARSHQRVNGSMIHLRPMSLDSSEASFAGLIPFLISLLHVQRPTAADERRMTQSPSFFYWLRYHLGCPWSAYNGHPLNGNNTDCPRMTSPTRAHVVCGHCSFHTRSNVRCGSFTEFHIPLAPSQDTYARS